MMVDVVTNYRSPNRRKSGNLMRSAATPKARAAIKMAPTIFHGNAVMKNPRSAKVADMPTSAADDASSHRLGGKAQSRRRSRIEKIKA
jgi:hypothetical protein